jgi:hypothetical protein
MATRLRPFLVRLIFVGLVYAMVEVVALAGLWVVEKRRGISYFPWASALLPETRKSLDDFLAGRPNPMVKHDSTLGWRRVTEVTAQGVRDNVTYAREPAPDRVRIAAFGDSFTYGSGVTLDESWAKRMAALNPSVEVLNYGIGAFGLDQAYLRYQQEGADLRPHIVFIGYMSENIARNVNVFRGFYGAGYPGFFFTKPRFVLEQGRLRLLPNPLRTVADYRRLRDDPETVLAEIGRSDFHFRGGYGAGPLDFSPSVRLVKLIVARARIVGRPSILAADGRYDTRSEAYDLTLRIFDAFHAEVIRNGAIPVIVVFPDINDHHRSRGGKERRYSPMLEYFRSRDYRYIDLLEAFEPVESRYPVDSLVVDWGHFSRIGNDLAARHILGRMADWKLIPSDSARHPATYALSPVRAAAR